MSSTQTKTAVPPGTAAEMLAVLADTIANGVCEQIPDGSRLVADLIDTIASVPGMDPIDEHDRDYANAEKEWKILAERFSLYPPSMTGSQPSRITSEILAHWDQLYSNCQTWRLLAYLVRMYADVIPDSPHICSYIDDLAHGVPGLDDTLQSYRPLYQ